MSLLKTASIGHVVLLEILGVHVRADQALLLARPGDEHQRRVELDAALRKHPRQLHRQHRAAAVVIGAVGLDVGIETGAGLAVAAARRRAPGVAAFETFWPPMLTVS